MFSVDKELTVAIVSDDRLVPVTLNIEAEMAISETLPDDVDVEVDLALIRVSFMMDQQLGETIFIARSNTRKEELKNTLTSSVFVEFAEEPSLIVIAGAIGMKVEAVTDGLLTIKQIKLSASLNESTLILSKEQIYEIVSDFFSLDDWIFDSTPKIAEGENITLIDSWDEIGAGWGESENKSTNPKGWSPQVIEGSKD